MSPRESIEGECARRGTDAVVAGCIDLLRGREADEALVLALAGPAAHRVLDGTYGGDGGGYWLRVWGARGLLWTWHDSATEAVVDALEDESWRVRELAARVVARHLLEAALPAVQTLTGDPRPRVRAAAARAVTVLTAAGA